MITSRIQLKEYIAADYKANKFSAIDRFTNSRCKFLRTLRKLEFCNQYKFLKVFDLFIQTQIISIK